MKQKVLFFLAIFLLLVVPVLNYSQTYIDVAPGVGTLTDAITKNTTPDVIFRLQRGANAIYLLNGSITVTVPIRIEAVAGTGARPQLIPAVSSGGVASYPFVVKANLGLKGLYITPKDENGGWQDRNIRVQADNLRITIDDCYLENTTQSHIRLDNKNVKLYITNSTFRNCSSDYANGRGIDDRGVDIDTLFVQNCTMYNIASRFLRDGGGVLNYAYVNHNTFVNNGLQVMQFGECPTLIFKNNMVVNCGFIGQGKSATTALLELKPLTSAVYQGRTQSVTVRNNNFYLAPSLAAKYTDTIVAVPKYDATMLAAVTASGLESTNLSEAITFTAPPPAVDNIITAYWTDPLKSSSTTAVQMRVTGDYTFSYPTTAQCYTKGTSNQPIGSLTWFNMTVGVEDREALPSSFSLSQNYPNPFNPSTMINYQIPENGFVSLRVYDMLGKEVITLVNEFQSAGKYSVNFDSKLRNISSGIYFYTIRSNNFVQTKKMMLVK